MVNVTLKPESRQLRLPLTNYSNSINIFLTPWFHAFDINISSPDSDIANMLSTKSGSDLEVNSKISEISRNMRLFFRLAQVHEQPYRLLSLSFAWNLTLYHDQNNSFVNQKVGKDFQKWIFLRPTYNQSLTKKLQSQLLSTYHLDLFNTDGCLSESPELRPYFQLSLSRLYLEFQATSTTWTI